DRHEDDPGEPDPADPCRHLRRACHAILLRTVEPRPDERARRSWHQASGSASGSDGAPAGPRLVRATRFVAMTTPTPAEDPWSDVPDTGTRPVQHDSRRPPRWVPRALAMAVVAVFVGIFAWYALGQLKALGVNILIAFFVALALEPIVVWLVRHG